MQPEPEIVTGELEVYEPPAGATSLFLTNDPDTFLQRASEAATAIARVVRERKLYTNIRGKDHVHIGGWTLCGSLLGVYAVPEWTHKIEDGWEARVVAMTRAGEVVGAAEAMCTRSESRWRNADEHAIRSMAQTRAASKALRLPLGFIFELEGIDATIPFFYVCRKYAHMSYAAKALVDILPTASASRRSHEHVGHSHHG